VPAGWTIQQITHCSESLACSDSLVNRSSATALGEADLTTTATIAKQVAKTVTATITTTAALVRQKIGIYPQALTATVTTSATIATVKVTPVTLGRDQQDVAVLVAAVGGGIGV
jgi:hypothetical protein